MDNSTSRARRVRVAVATVIVLLLVGGTFLFFKIRRASQPTIPLDQTFGLKKLPGVEESGFYGPETEKSAAIPFRWTNGAARLSIPLGGEKPVGLHVKLGLTIPKPTTLTVKVNGTPLFSDSVAPRGEWARTFNLSGMAPSGALDIEILSDTFVPTREKEEVGDGRKLGVRVHGITLIREFPDLTGLNLAAEPVAGVEESGFHNREKCDGQPCRWTDGSAKLIVPVRADSRWKSLIVAAEIPDRPNWRVKVAVNGSVLFDEDVKSGAVWSKELPLDGVALGGEAMIELMSSSIEPGTTKSKDARRLGVRVRKLVLAGE